MKKGRRPGAEQGDVHPTRVSLFWTFSGARFKVEEVSRVRHWCQVEQVLHRIPEGSPGKSISAERIM
jgi:hypothetical protein